MPDLFDQAAARYSGQQPGPMPNIGGGDAFDQAAQRLKVGSQLGTALKGGLRGLTMNPWDLLVVPSMARLGLPVYKTDEFINKLAVGGLNAPSEMAKDFAKERIPRLEKVYNEMVQRKKSAFPVDEERLKYVQQRLQDARSTVGEELPFKEGEPLLPREDIAHPPMSPEEFGTLLTDPAKYFSAPPTPGARLPYNPLSPFEVLGDTGWGGAIKQGAYGLASGLTQPEMLATLPFAGYKPMQAYFLSKTLPATLEETIDTAVAPTGTEQKQHAVSALMNGLFSALLGRGLGAKAPVGLAPEAPPRPTEPTEPPGPKLLGPGTIPLGPPPPAKRAYTGPIPIIGEQPPPEVQFIPRGGTTVAEALGRPEAPTPLAEVLGPFEPPGAARVVGPPVPPPEPVYPPPRPPGPVPPAPPEPGPPLAGPSYRHAGVEPPEGGGSFIERAAAFLRSMAQRPEEKPPPPTKLKTAEQARAERARAQGIRQPYPGTPLAAAYENVPPRPVPAKQMTPEERSAAEDAYWNARIEYNRQASAAEMAGQPAPPVPPILAAGPPSGAVPRRGFEAPPLQPQAPIPMPTEVASAREPTPVLPGKRGRAERRPGASLTDIQEKTPNLADALEVFRRGSTVDPKTMKGYLSRLGVYAQWLMDHNMDISSRGAIYSYFDDIRDPESPYYVGKSGTVKGMRTALGALHTFLRKREHPLANILREVEAIDIKAESEETRALTMEEFQSLYQNIKGSAVPGSSRIRAMTGLQFSAAARGGAISDLRMKDIDWQNQTVNLYAGTREANSVPVEPEAMQALQDYLRSEGRLDSPPDAFVFQGTRGGRFTLEQYNRDLAQYGQDAGVGHVSSHMLRATRATQLSHQGVPQANIRRWGGWRGEVPKTYQKAYRLGDELDPFHPEFRTKLQQLRATKGRTRYDPQSQRGIQGGIPQGQEPGQVPQPSGGQETPPPSGVFQAPEERPVRPPGEPPPGSERRAGVPLPEDFQTLDGLRKRIQDLLASASANPKARAGIFNEIRPLQEQVEQIVARNGGRARTATQLRELEAQRKMQISKPGEIQERRAGVSPFPEGEGDRIKPEDLRAAVRMGGRVVMGQPGDTHADIISRAGGDPRSIPHESLDRGFVTLQDPETLINRVDAARRSGLTGTADAGGLDSMDLPRTQAERDRLIAEIEAQFPEEEGPPGGITERHAGVGPGDFGDYQKMKERLSGLIARANAEKSAAERGPIVEEIRKLQSRMQEMRAARGGKEPRGPKDRMKGMSMRERAAALSMEAEVTPEVREAGVPLPTGEQAFKEATTDELFNSLKEVKAKPFSAPRGVARAVGKRPSDVGFASDTMRGLSNLASKASFRFLQGSRLLMPIDALFEILENPRLGERVGKYDGWLFQNFRWPLDGRFKAELNRRNSYLDPISKLIKQYKMDKYSGQRIGVYAHAQQEGGIERMKESGITQEQIDDILKDITPQEKEVYNLMRQNMDASLPEVQRIAKLLYNRDVTAVKNYFPWLRQWEIYDRPPTEIVAPKEGGPADAGIVSFEELNQDYTMRGTKVEQGFTIPRVPEATSPIQVNAFDIYFRHMRDVAHFVEMQEKLHQLGRVARTETFRDKFGTEGQRIVLDWLNTLARQGRSTKRIWQLDALRRNVTVGVISGRLASQLVHLANAPLANMRVGNIQGYADALNDVMFHTREGSPMYDWMKKNFPETFERGGIDPSLEEFETVSEQGRRMSKLASWGFKTQKYLDRINAQATVLGVYKRLLKEKGLDPDKFLDTPFDEEAGARAQTAARRAVASPLAKDIPQLITRGGSLARLFTQFQNTFLDQWSNISHDLWGSIYGAGSDFIAGREGAGAKSQYAAAMALSVMGMLVVETYIKQESQNLVQKTAGYDPRRKKGFWERFQHEAYRRIPGFSQINAIWQYNESGIPAFDVVGQEVKRLREIKEGAVKDPILAGIDVAAGVGEMAGVPGSSQAGEFFGAKRRAALGRRSETEMRETGQRLFPTSERYTIGQRGRIARELSLERPQQTIEERSAQAIRGERAQEARRKELTEDMPTPHKKWLNQHQLQIEGYRNIVRYGNETIQLTRDEQDFYHQQLVEQYNRVIDQAIRSGRIDQFPNQRMKNDWWQRQQSRVHGLAQERLKGYITTGKKQTSAFSVYQE
jgi:integrase